MRMLVAAALIAASATLASAYARHHAVEYGLEIAPRGERRYS